MNVKTKIKKHGTTTKYQIYESLENNTHFELGDLIVIGKDNHVCVGKEEKYQPDSVVMVFEILYFVGLLKTKGERYKYIDEFEFEIISK